MCYSGGGGTDVCYIFYAQIIIDLCCHKDVRVPCRLPYVLVLLLLDVWINKLNNFQLEIWEERKVFGSHPQDLKDVMLGEQLPAPLEFKRKRSRAVKIIKRDTRSIKTVIIFSAILPFINTYKSKDVSALKNRN